MNIFESYLKILLLESFQIAALLVRQAVGPGSVSSPCRFYVIILQVSLDLVGARARVVVMRQVKVNFMGSFEPRRIAHLLYIVGCEG
jgi:hypothetical protein